MSGYASKAEAVQVVRSTIAMPSSSRPDDLPCDLAAYKVAGIVRAVVSSRGPGYGWGIEYDPVVFWRAVRANLRGKPLDGPTGMSWSEVADRDAQGFCPSSLDYDEVHIPDGETGTCAECGATL